MFAHCKKCHFMLVASNIWASRPRQLIVLLWNIAGPAPPVARLQTPTPGLNQNTLYENCPHSSLNIVLGLSCSTGCAVSLQLCTLTINDFKSFCIFIKIYLERGWLRNETVFSCLQHNTAHHIQTPDQAQTEQSCKTAVCRGNCPLEAEHRNLH